MKHIVFIVGSYYPYFSAVGICCYNIAEEMAKDNKVTVICMKSRFGQSEEDEYKGQTIIRVSHKWWNLRLKINDKIKTSSGFVKKFYILLLNAVRAKEYLHIIFSRLSLNNGWVKSYQRALEGIKEQVDVIIPMSSPMEAVAAGMKYKHKYDKVKIIPYLFDPFVNNHTLHRAKWIKRLKYKNNIKFEINMLNISTKVFCVNQLHAHFIQYKKYMIKLIFTEHPLLKKLYDIEKCAKRYRLTICLTYAGIFDKIIRNPEYFLVLMLKELPNINGKLHLYCYGNCNHIVGKYCNESKGNIINHGYVPKEEADRAVYESDFLIGIGNIDNLQVPSKVFEYMSTGKPIIYFYTVDDDINVKILKDYPLSLCLKQDDKLLQNNANLFVKFCQDNKNETLNFNEVEKIFYYATPNYIARTMIDFIDSGKSSLDGSKDLTYGNPD